MPDAEVISHAVVVWTGYGDAPLPVRDPARLVDVYGESAAVELLPILQRLEFDFYESDASNTVAGLTEMGEKTATDFRVRHPEVTTEAVEALVWCYTRDWK